MKKVTAILLVLAVLIALLPANIESRASEGNPALKTWKFDLGGNGTEAGYTGVSAEEKYTDEKQYGFMQTHLAENVEAGGTGALSDAVHFGGAYGEFRVKLDPGVYKITVTTGNDVSSIIVAEGVPQLLFMTGNNAVDSFTIPVTDGYLDIYASSGVGSTHSISTIEIEQTSTKTTTKPTIWILGDSTVANYYNVPADSKRGWGEYLDEYIDTDVYDIRNLSISGARSNYYDGNYYSTVDKYAKSSDIIIIALGINDYVDELTDYNLNNDPIDSTKYVSNITGLVRKAKSKDMTVYLCKEQGENSDTGHYPLYEYKWFGKELDQIAKSEQVGVIDLFRPWLEMLMVNVFYDQIDYYAEGIHPNETGARKLAEMVSEQLFPHSEPIQYEEDPFEGITPTAVYETVESGEPISNPHKGFIMTSYAPHMIDSSLGYEYGIDGPLNNRAWDCCTIVCGEPKWMNLNPGEGIYDWSYIDKMLVMCEKYGLTYGIRFLPYASSTGTDDNYGSDHDFTPQWVYDKGAEKVRLPREYDENVLVDIPKWDDPVYLQAIKDFYKAMADKYDNDPRVEFIDVSIFGDWGEWHNGMVRGAEMPSLEIQKEMLSYIKSLFKNKLLAVPSDARGEIYRYALSIGIAKRDNGLVAIPGREWDLIPTYEANMPVIGEYYLPISMMKKIDRKNDRDYIPWTEERFCEVIEISHLSILAFDQDSHSSYEFYLEHHDIVDKMCNRLGYNFTVTSARRYDNKLAVKIRNTGLAPAFFNIDLCAEITDESGNKLGDFGEPVRIEKGTFHDGMEKTYIFEYNGDPEENTKLCLAMYDCDNPLAEGKNPTVRFDNKNNLPNKRFELIEIEEEEIVTSEPEATPEPGAKKDINLKTGLIDGKNDLIIEEEKEGNELKIGDIIRSESAEYTIISSEEVSYDRPIKESSKITIPETVSAGEKTYTVTSIKDKAFYKNTRLKKVIIGKNVKKIGTRAFKGCKKLKFVKIEGDEVTFGKECFKGISKKAVFKVPKAKVKAYKKQLLKKGKAPKKIKVKKSGK